MTHANHPAGGTAGFDPVRTALASLDHFEDAAPVALASGRARLVPLRSRRADRPARRHVCASEALGKGPTVQECVSGATVPFLELHNPLDLCLLGLEGMLLFGGRQNRVNLRTWLVRPHATVRLPVACVQQGRWHYQGPASMTPATHRAPRSVLYHGKLAKAQGRRSSQGEVWDAVAEELATRNARNASSDLLEGAATAQRGADVRDIEERLAHALRGACGYALEVDGTLQSVELLQHPEDFECQRASTARTLAFELALVPAREPAPAPATPDWSGELRSLLLGSPVRVEPGVDLGQELATCSPDGTFALTAFVDGGEMLTLSAVRRAGRTPQGRFA